MVSVSARSEIVRVRDEFGPYLIGRDVGSRIREQYFSGDPLTWPRTLDLSGVEQVTESCADELLGTLARRAGIKSVRTIVLENCAPTVREAIDYVLSLVEEPPPAPTREGIERLLERRNRGAARR
jgi:hypothetical protein